MDGYLEKAVPNMFVYPVNTCMWGALDYCQNVKSTKGFLRDCLVYCNEFL